MPLLARLPAHHTIREFRQAASRRYQEGRRLAVAGDRLAAIYFWGYAAEMLLKAAYFRLSGKGPADAVTLADLNNAKQYAQTRLQLNWQGNLHDLPLWGRLLIEDRKRRGVPYAPAFARALASRIRQVYINWREHLRYRPNRPYLGEVAQTYQALTWLVGQYRFL